MQQPVYVYFSRISWAVVSSSTAAQLLAAAERVPFAGPGLKPLVLCIFTCQCRRHVKARGRLSERTLDRPGISHRILRILVAQFGNQTVGTSIKLVGLLPQFSCTRSHRIRPRGDLW